jgi:hypothetical protein
MSWFSKKAPPKPTPPPPKAVQAVQKPVSSVKPPASTPAVPSTQSQGWHNTSHATTGGLVVEEGLTSVSENAAMAFANGQYEQAQSILTQHLTETRGDTEKIIWYLLLDLYQIQRNKMQFEKLAELFAKKFGVSPPSWADPVTQNESFFSGRNVMVLEGDLDKGIADKAKDFLRVTKDQKTCKFECSRVDLKASTNEGLNIWLETMRKVRKMKAKAVLMGETGIIDTLKALIQKEETQSTQMFWLILLELLQWRGKEEEFEDLAFQFATLFDVSPPGFDADGVMKQDLAIEAAEETIKTAPVPPAVLTEGAMDDWLDKLTEWMAENVEKQAELPFQHVERVSFEAAGSWASWSHKDVVRARRVRIVQPNHWVLVLMNMVNLMALIKAVSKKA